jgi:3-isopropylmalate dehydrogenase
LRYSLSLKDEANAIESAIMRIIEEGYRTEDIREEGKEIVGTHEMGRLIAEAIV